MRHLKRGWLFGIVAVLSGCVNNPLWRFDKYEVQGQISGDSCTVLVSGKAVPSDSIFRPALVTVMADYAFNIPMPQGTGLKTIFCRGLIISTAWQEGSMPPAGIYRVSMKQGYPTGTASANVFYAPNVTHGWWPLALDVYLEGVDGTVEIDSMTPERAWARFHFRARRAPSGP